MHPIIVQELINERHASLRRDLHPPPIPHSYRGRRSRAGTARQRLGWTLVEVGLRLTTT